MRIIIIFLILTALFVSFGSAQVQEKRNYGYNGSEWIPFLTTSDGRLRVDMNLVNVTANGITLNGTTILDWGAIVGGGGITYDAGDGIVISGSTISATAINGTGTSNAMNNQTIANALLNTTIVRPIELLTINDSNRALYMNISGGSFLAPICFNTDVCIQEGTASWIHLRDKANTTNRNLRVDLLYATTGVEIAPNGKLLLGYYPYTDKWIMWNTTTDAMMFGVNSTNKGFYFNSIVNITNSFKIINDTLVLNGVAIRNWSELNYSVDTNDTPQVDILKSYMTNQTTTECPTDYYAYSFYGNGTPKCRVDTGGGSSGVDSVSTTDDYLTINPTTGTVYVSFNEDILNNGTFYYANNPSGYITSGDVPTYETDSAHDQCSEITDCVSNAVASETDPIYSGNSYATGMNQGVATGDSPTFANIYTGGGISGSSLGVGGASIDAGGNYYTTTNVAGQLFVGNGYSGTSDCYDSALGGQVCSAGGIVYSITDDPSDKIFKNDIINLTLDISKFSQLKPSEWIWNLTSKNNTKGYGLIAQDIQLIYPQLVKTGQKKDFIGYTNITISTNTTKNDINGKQITQSRNITTKTPQWKTTNYSTIDYAGIIALQIEKIKELEEINDAQEKRINEQDLKITELTNDNKKMKDSLCLLGVKEWC